MQDIHHGDTESTEKNNEPRMNSDIHGWKKQREFPLSRDNAAFFSYKLPCFLGAFSHFCFLSV